VRGRAVGLRQDDPAALCRRAAGADRRRGPAPGGPGGRPPARPGGGVPGVRPQPVPLDDRPRQRRAAAAGQAAPPGPPGRAGGRGPGRGRPGRRPRRLPLAAVGRDAAAGGHRPGRGLRAPRAADGRALRRRRRPDPGRAGGPGAFGLAPHRGDHRVRHPRHRRGRLPGPAGAGAVLLAHRRPGGPGRGPSRRARPAHTRSDPRFTELRTHVYAQIQRAKRGGDQGQARSAGLAERRPPPGG
jgi:translation initiation factor IF-2